MKKSDEIAKALMNPVAELVIPTDKFSDWLLDQDKPKIEITKSMFEGTFKGKEVSSTVTFKFGGGLLRQFDKSVLVALISEFRAGNKFASVQRLFETLGGGNHLTPKMKDKLLSSVRKLMTTYVKINMAEIVQKCYTGKKTTMIEGMLLPCKIETVEINGKITEGTIHLLGDSPLFQVADTKNQIARLPSKFLSKIRATENLITLHWFLLERVAEIVGSNSEDRKKRVRKLNTFILFETLCQKCGFINLGKIQKSRLRENVEKILEQFKICGLIENFNFVKKDEKIYSIEIFIVGGNLQNSDENLPQN